MIEQKELIIDAAATDYKVQKVDDPNIIGPVGYGLKKFNEEKEGVFVFGKGLLSGSHLPGTKRLIFTAYSPLWNHFYISTMGGAAYVFHNLGIDFVCVKGSCQNYSVLEIKRENGEIKVSFHDADVEKIWSGYSDELGVYALQKYVYDNYGKNFESCRILATGPSALKTRMGAIASAPIDKNGITPVDCWAGRGGMGTKLVQHHKIAAIIYGGDYREPEGSPLLNRQEIDAVFKEKLNKTMIQEDMDSTTKYRYDEILGTGGTLGVNFTKLKSWMFSFNYQSVNYSDEDRLKIHQELVVNHYLKQFNEETIAKKQFRHCGEPCGALCKKMNGKFKKDYEPYEALGPNAGIFDQRAAEKINHHVDSMGFDAIQAGTLVSWIMECIDKDKFPGKDFGIDTKPRWDFNNFDVINDSAHNADMACRIIDNIMNNDECEIFRNGIRNAAKAIDKKYGTDTVNLAVYNSFGENGCMVPNQYWVPGMFSPMPIMGKYFEFYGSDFLAPRELGKKNVERMIRELYSDNAGICRFHRTWVEKLIGDLVNRLYGENIDFYTHHKNLVRMINEGNQPVFWESERTVDLIKAYLEKIHRGEPDNPELSAWVERFHKDKWQAAKEYWSEILAGQNEAFG